jgi:kumamolisin
MKKAAVWTCVVALAVFSSSGASFAQQASTPIAKSHMVIPGSSVTLPSDIGVNAHTHLRIMAFPTGMNLGPAAQPAELAPFPGFLIETPASLGCVYHLVATEVFGCNPNLTTANPNVGKGVGAIALVDAFDDPTAASDLATFSAQFGLPAANFNVVFAQGTRPGIDPTGGWEIEESLDIEWAHAMAPNAKIFLVEAANNSFINLLNAVQVAAALVATSGGGEISMSWGGGEFTQETSLDSIFTVPGIVYFASTGDSPGPEWPAVSPNVVAAGGTTVSRDTNSGDFILENTWQDAGGGPSLVEPRPAFQNGVQFIVGNARGTPDLAFDANPTTGVWVFDSNPVLGTGWFLVGGTSVASPSLAGIINAAGGRAISSQAENQTIYNHTFDPLSIRDIFYGTCGLNAGNFSIFGYDFCTGVGVVNTLHGK